MFHEVALAVCLGAAVYAITIDVAPPKPHNFQPRVALLKPTGFSVTISDTLDIEDMQLLGSINVPYNISDPYRSSIRGYTANVNEEDTLTLAMPEIVFKDGDILCYWLLIGGYAVYDRYAIHNLSFTVKEINGDLILHNSTTNYVVSTYTYVMRM